jgi:hypothetical protein
MLGGMHKKGLLLRTNNLYDKDYRLKKLNILTAVESQDSHA